MQKMLHTTFYMAVAIFAAMRGVSQHLIHTFQACFAYNLINKSDMYILASSVRNEDDECNQSDWVFSWLRNNCNETFDKGKQMEVIYAVLE